MSITIKQLQALAEEFDFDLLEARAFLGHTTNKKKTETLGDRLNDKAKTKSKTNTSEREDKGEKKKKVSGYTLYAKSVSASVTSDLRGNLPTGVDKLAPGATLKEIGRRWKALDEASRKKWNRKAAEQDA